MLDHLSRLDRRWIFLLMLLALSVPILQNLRFPAKLSEKTEAVFRTIEDQEEGSLILMSFDFDPSSAGEIKPMAASFTRHCAFRKHRLIYMTLWPAGTPMIQDAVKILAEEFPDYKYGRDYVVLGYQSGEQGIIRNVMSDLRGAYPRDSSGLDLDDLEITRNLKNFQSVDLIVNVSSGSPGSKEWVQYAATPFGRKMITGTIGVQATQLYPYYPRQLAGLLGAIKGAAEYEQRLISAYPVLKKKPSAADAMRRMAPQLSGHLLIVALIAAGNAIHFFGRKRGAA